MPLTEEDYVKLVTNQADSYQMTINVLVCLDSLLRWDNGNGAYPRESLFLPGRAMDPAEDEADTQHPDVVLQYDGTQGSVGEVKITASTRNDFEIAHEQLSRYDQDLVGWHTDDETVDSHDIFVVVRYAHSTRAERYFEEAEFERSFALLSAVKDTQDNEFITFEKRLGTFDKSSLNEKLREQVPIPLEPLLGRLASTKFCDAEPPCVEYTMHVLWHHYISTLTEEEHQRIQLRDQNQIQQRRVEIPKARDFLQEVYSITHHLDADTMHRQPTIPKREWLRRAMDTFVSVDRAEPDKEDHNTYWVRYSKRSRNTDIIGFARQVYNKTDKVSSGGEGSRKGGADLQQSLDFD